ncbi:MAG: bifunctional glutamate N-acetyltransferase/amino-acid acetyltransferase ArgJ [Pseudomonadota bacterium]|jgi:glutamate N-acetyltransferase/amino-acid N-acetyltransferase
MGKSSKSITEVAGVYASGIAAGIKANGKRDLAFVFVPQACGSAGVFTQSAFAAPPVQLSRQILRKGTIKAVVLNAGNANAGTGKLGLRDARETAKITAQLLGISPSEVAVASTGVIGRPLPMERVRVGLKQLLAKPLVRRGREAATAVMTTDLTRKEVYLTGLVGGKRISVAGFAKGSGMIAPNMATTLGVIATDAKISSVLLSKLLRDAADASFNMLSVDTDTSTNDTLLAFATGQNGPRITSKRHQQELLELLTLACVDLARSIAADGEGATKLIEVTVAGARSLRDARCIAKNIISSPLVKTAIHGADPNWGRVLAAAGKDPSARVEPQKIDLTFAGVSVMRRGEIVRHNRNRIHKLMLGKEVRIHLNLNIGKASAKAWGCDLTRGYVDINVSYS